MLRSIGRPSRMAVTFLAALALLLAALGSISLVRATEQASCPEIVKDRVTDLWYSVTRGSDNLVVTSLDDVHQGDMVEAHFTVVEGCEDVHVQINSYTASGVTHETSKPQKLFDKAEGTFGPGEQALGPIAIPDCFFQADVVVRAAVGEGEGRALLDATLQGENACTETPDQSVSEGQSASETESVAESEKASGEQSLKAGEGTPGGSVSDGALSLNGSSPLPTIAFSLILLASLGGLAYANVKTVRNRI